jgi:antibiotic biosynthesis monooxygenase
VLFALVIDGVLVCGVDALGGWWVSTAVPSGRRVAARRWAVYARSTTIQAKPSYVDAGLRHVRDDVLPALTGTDGCIGMSALVDRESGRCIVTTAWRSEQAMLASAKQVRPIRDRAVAAFGAAGADVEQWEIAVFHRNHMAGDGACCRVTWVRGDPANVDRGVDAFRLVSLPAMEGSQGFCSASLMIDRESGAAVSSVAYDSVDTMRRTREQADEIRMKATSQAGVRIVEVHEFELALAHLRVPELA